MGGGGERIEELPARRAASGQSAECRVAVRYTGNMAVFRSDCTSKLRPRVRGWLFSSDARLPVRMVAGPTTDQRLCAVCSYARAVAG